MHVSLCPLIAEFSATRGPCSVRDPEVPSSDPAPLPGLTPPERKLQQPHRSAIVLGRSCSRFLKNTLRGGNTNSPVPAGARALTSLPSHPLRGSGLPPRAQKCSHKASPQRPCSRRGRGARCREQSQRLHGLGKEPGPRCAVSSGVTHNSHIHSSPTPTQMSS